MPIVNRDLDVSEQKYVLSQTITSAQSGTTLAMFGNGVTCVVASVPCASELKAVNIAAFGLSGAPTAELKVHRFIAGAGITVITGLASSMIMQTFGTSGALSASLVASGSTLLNLLAGDQICLHAGTANTAADKVIVGVVLKALQDIISHYGSST